MLTTMLVSVEVSIKLGLMLTSPTIQPGHPTAP